MVSSTRALMQAVCKFTMEYIGAWLEANSRLAFTDRFKSRDMACSWLHKCWFEQGCCKSAYMSAVSVSVLLSMHVTEQMRSYQQRRNNVLMLRIFSLHVAVRFNW